MPVPTTHSFQAIARAKRFYWYYVCGVVEALRDKVNPQGCEVFSFKQPTAEELEHDFLWRTSRCLPERGRIGIFNRSFYEDVLITRVHPEILHGHGLSDALIDKKSLWEQRYRSINDLATHLHRNGTQIVKIFLHLSKDEQAKRFRAHRRPGQELEVQPRRHPRTVVLGHLHERLRRLPGRHQYRKRPWYVVPADDKHNARLIVSQIVLDTLADLKMAYPKTTAKRHRELESFRKQL